MTEQELRKRLTDQLVILSGYPKLPEQVQGYIDDIMTLIKEAGYVKLAEDQTAPEHRFTVMGYPVSVDIAHYAREAGWRKVILESK